MRVGNLTSNKLRTPSAKQKLSYISRCQFFLLLVHERTQIYFTFYNFGSKFSIREDNSSTTSSDGANSNNRLTSECLMQM